MPRRRKEGMDGHMKLHVEGEGRTPNEKKTQYSSTAANTFVDMQTFTVHKY